TATERPSTDPTNPDRSNPPHTPDLATALSNLANRQSETGDRQAALTTATEAVHHYRTLTQANPAAHLPNLATALNNLAVQQSETGTAKPPSPPSPKPSRSD
ncbi:hypothetical protein, partial [Streptomyces afghaniensis]|uniref:hypothetical protein n=1 Tax=Streptomyces afghaniensis TaxID=66865 RepID=UPI00056862A5